MYLFYQVFHPELLYEKSVPKKICKTRRKTSVPGSFLKEDLDLSLATLLKVYINFIIFLREFCEIFKNTYSGNLCERLLLRSLRVSVRKVSSFYYEGNCFTYISLIIHESLNRVFFLENFPNSLFLKIPQQTKTKKVKKAVQLVLYD